MVPVHTLYVKQRHAIEGAVHWVAWHHGGLGVLVKAVAIMEDNRDPLSSLETQAVGDQPVQVHHRKHEHVSLQGRYRICTKCPVTEHSALASLQLHFHALSFSIALGFHPRKL